MSETPEQQRQRWIKNIETLLEDVEENRREHWDASTRRISELERGLRDIDPCNWRFRKD